MTLEYLQKGLSDWLWLQPEKLHSFNTLKSISQQLYHQGYQGSVENHGFSMIFLPLLRWGIIEFYGNNKFGLSPSAVLRNSNSILYWNMRNVNQSQSCRITLESPFQIKIYKLEQNNFNPLLEAGQKLVTFQLKNYLKRFPSYSRIIEMWDNEVINEFKDFLFLNQNDDWVRNWDRRIFGVFKKSNEVFSQRILRYADDKWKTIPKRDTNIESFNVAVIWSRLQNKSEIKISYQRKDEILIVQEYYFPFLLERLLFVNTILNRPNQYKLFNREYFISNNDFGLLNKFFDYKIPIS